MVELGRMMENDTTIETASPGLVGRGYEGLQGEAGGSRDSFLGGSGVGWETLVGGPMPWNLLGSVSS